jgi:hypothetical protein
MPMSDMKPEFTVDLDKLTLAVMEGKVRTRKELNPHSEQYFTIYALADLEKLFVRKKPASNFSKKIKKPFLF